MNTDFEEFVRVMSPSWLAIPFGDHRIEVYESIIHFDKIIKVPMYQQEISDRYEVTEIPSLVILWPTGQINTKYGRVKIEVCIHVHVNVCLKYSFAMLYVLSERYEL